MLRLTSVACAIAIAFSTPLTAFEIPLFEQNSTQSAQVESPDPLTISEETLEYESILHLADYITAAKDLVVVYNSSGLALIRQGAEQFTILREYNSEELDLNGLNYISLSNDGSRLFIFKYDGVVAYAVANDGTLTELARDNHYSYTQHRMDATSSYVKTDYTFPGISLTVNRFNKTSSSFSASQPIYLPDQPQFAIYDEAKNTLVLGYYDYNLSTSLVQSYKLDAQGQLNLVSALPINNLVTQQNIAYSQDSGALFLIGSSSTQFQLALDGTLQHITDNDAILPTSYPNKAIIAGSTLYVSYGDRIESFSIEGTEVSRESTLPNLTSRDITSLNGNLTNLEDNSLNYYPQGTDNSTPLVLERGQQGFSLLSNAVSNAENISFNDKYFFRANHSGAELYKVAENGQIKSLNFFESRDFYPGDTQWYYTAVHQLGASSVLAIRGTQMRLFAFSEENEAITQTVEVDLNDMLSDVNQTSNVQSTAVFGSYLLVRTNDKLHLFTYADNTLTYLDTAASGVNEFTELPELNYSVVMNGHLVVLNDTTKTVQEFSVVNDKLKQRDLFNSPQSQYGISQLRFVSGQIHLQFNSTLYVYKEIDGQFKLLSLNEFPSHRGIYLNERLVLIPVDSYRAQITKLDLETGILEEQHTIEFDSYLSLRHAFMMGQNLYLEDTNTPLTVKRYLINRAPDLTQTPAKMQLNQGVAYSTELTSLIQDADAGNTMTFTLVDEVPGITVTEQGTLNYDGSPLSTTEVVVRATDNTGLYSDITLTFEHNKAPALAQAWVTPVINQNKAFVLDLNEFFADPEGSVLSYEITSTADLTVSAKGIVSGTITTGQAHQLTVLVKDSKGATSSHTLDLTVNAAPALKGSANLTLSTDETASIDLATLFTDAEAQAMSFTATGLPAGLTLSGSTISGKVANAGKYSALITASDSAGASSQVTLNFEATQPKGSSGSFGWYSVFAFIALVIGRRFRKV